MCQFDIRGEDLCDEVIILIVLLSPLDRYVTSHLLQEQQTAVHAKQNCMHSSHPSLLETQLQQWIDPCAIAVKSEDNTKSDLGEASQRAAQRSHDSCKVLGLWIHDGYLCLLQILVLLLFYITKKISNRFTPSHASDRGMAQHYLKQHKPILSPVNKKVLLIRASRKSGFQLPVFSPS